MMVQPAHLMLVDQYETGHNGYYIQVLCRRWIELNSSARLSIVVNKRFRKVHQDLVQWIESKPQIALIEADFDIGKRDGLWSLVRTDQGYGRVVSGIIEANRPDRVVLLCFDQFQVALGLSMRFSFEVRISGIYYRPIMHYRDVVNDSLGFGHRPNAALRQALLRFACRNPHLDTIFSLDPFLPGSPQVAKMPARFVALPEPTPERNLSATPDPETPTVSLVGSLARRKGVLELLEALSLLPEHLVSRTRFVLAGPVSEDLRPALEVWMRKLESKNVRLDVTDRFLNDSEIEMAIAVSHLVLLPYQDHIGMSNLLVRAAKYGRPVLGPDSGLLGALIKQHGLGAVVDTKRPQAIARGLAMFLDAEEDYPFDPEKAKSFAGRNTETAFADTILDQPTASR